jgi:hypothetical protein
VSTITTFEGEDGFRIGADKIFCEREVNIILILEATFFGELCNHHLISQKRDSVPNKV